MFERELGRFRDLLVGRFPLELGGQCPLGARHLLLALDDVDGYADRARLVRHAALHGLPDPPRRVRRELVTAAPVELLDRPDEPDDPLLDQVEQRDAVALVLLGDRHDEAEVGVDHQIFRFLVAVLDQLGQLHLLGGGQQLVAAGLVEEELEGVRGGGCEVAVHIRAPDRVRSCAVIGEHDVPLLQLLEEAGGLILVEIGFLQELADRGEVEAAELLSLFQHGL